MVMVVREGGLSGDWRLVTGTLARPPHQPPRPLGETPHSTHYHHHQCGAIATVVSTQQHIQRHSDVTQMILSVNA